MKFQVVSFARAIVEIQTNIKQTNLQEIGIFGTLGLSITSTFAIFTITMPPITTAITTTTYHNCHIGHGYSPQPTELPCLATPGKTSEDSLHPVTTWQV